MTTAAVQSRLALALDATFDAANAIQEMFRGLSIDVVWKHDGSPVTKADQQAEKILRQRINNVFPEDAIIGEEHEAENGTSGFKWIIDPLDGTESFIRKVPVWGTLVGLEHEGEMVAGLCYMPAQREFAWSSKGAGCWWVPDTTGAPNIEALRDRAQRAQVSPMDTLKEAMIVTSGQGAFHRSCRVEAFNKLRAATRKDRGWGNCYGHLLVATGRVEASIEPKIREWDVAPFASMLAESGGKLTDFDGKESVYSTHCICSNGRLHGAIIKTLHSRG
jgi:histidinol phosphatase-like enzyme (inositol monophosphatase family)